MCAAGDQVAWSAGPDCDSLTQLGGTDQTEVYTLDACPTKVDPCPYAINNLVAHGPLRRHHASGQGDREGVRRDKEDGGVRS